MFEPVPYKSSGNIQGVWYNQDTHVLKVQFAKGQPYLYANVTYNMVKMLEAAESAGRWIAANITSKPDQHPYTQ